MKYFYKIAAFEHLLKAIPRRHANNIIKSSYEYTDKIKYITNSRRMLRSIGTLTKADQQRTVLHEQLLRNLDKAKIPYKNRRQAEDMAWEFRELQRAPSKYRKVAPLTGGAPKTTSAFQKALQKGKKIPAL